MFDLKSPSPDNIFGGSKIHKNKQKMQKYLHQGKITHFE